MKRLLSILAGTLLAASIRAQAPAYTIWFDRPNTLENRAVWLKADGSGQNPDQAWESTSLPLGNGSLGANIMGSVSAERITLNEKTLWKGGPGTSGGAGYYWNVNKQSAPVLKIIRQAFAEGNLQKAAELTCKNFNGLAGYEENTEHPFRFGSFTTMGEIYVETGLSEIGMNDYRRALSVDSALATVSFRKDGVAYRRDCFISYPDSVMVLRFSADRKGMQHLVLSYCPNPEATGETKPDGDNGLIYTAKLNNNNMKFALRIHATHKGGSLTVKDGKIRVDGADEAVFLVTGDTDYRMNFNPDFSDPKAYVGADPEQTTHAMMQQAAGKSYDELYRRHKEDYTNLFGRVKLRLNPNAPMTLQYPAVTDLPTYQRLARYRKGLPDYQLEELYYQFGRYLLIAASRPGNMPANLQGIWHNNVDGPWRVDYHNNINIQMNYWLACSANLDECMLPLVDFIRTLVKPGERTAQAYFGARGWTASISANIFGFTAPLSSEDMSWNFSPVAGPWLATHLWEYYDYTRDKKFLKEIGYDLIKSSANFAVDYLWHRPDGTYTAAPSTSPEHGPIDQGATFSHAVIREILLDAIDAAKALGVDAAERKQWQRVLDNLAPYRIGRYGQLMEWSSDIDDPKDEHRHVNHLFGLHPGHTLSPVTTPELARAAKVVLEHRGDGATGWSMGWKLNQWARLQDGNHAYKLFGNLLKNGTTDNLWDIHPPFQIDGNFGGAAGITEMLLQSHMGFIQLLPALPDAWKDGTVDGLRARGNFEVGITWQDGKLKEATVLANAGGPCNVTYGNQSLAFKTVKGKSYRIVFENDKLRKTGLGK